MSEPRNLQFGFKFKAKQTEEVRLFLEKTLGFREKNIF
jgi:hypothetical protein